MSEIHGPRLRPLQTSFLAVFFCGLLVTGTLPDSANAEELLRILWSNYDPPVVRSNHRGPVSVELIIDGDVPEIFLHTGSWSPTGWNEDHESFPWTRTTTQRHGGHLASVFRRSFDDVDVVNSCRWLDDRNCHNPWTFGSVPLGYVTSRRDSVFEAWQLPAVGIPRVPMNLPLSRVERINDEVQYSSHLVNLLIPGFGDGLTGGGGYDLKEVAQRFYRYFGDNYETIAVLPGSAGTASFAYHNFVQNRIQGIGLEVYDHTQDYGSSGRLRSMHLYVPSGYGQGYVVLHEMAHHWWDYWDWDEVTGVENVTDGIHGPRWMVPGYRGARLSHDGNRFVWEAYTRSTSVRYLTNPLTLYKMGWIGPDDVPEVLVPEDQQYPVGKPGVPYRKVHIDDFIARHGIRTGPVEGDSWRMATVVVTRDRLLTEDEMSAWNLAAARLEASVGGGVVPSFLEATGGRMRLHTHVEAAGRQRLRPPLAVETMPFMAIDASEVPGIRFDSALATLVAVGVEVAVGAEIMDVSLLGRARPICGTWKRVVPFEGATHSRPQKQSCGGREMSRGSGRFRIEWQPFAREDVGLYTLYLSGIWERPVVIGYFSVRDRYRDTWRILGDAPDSDAGRAAGASRVESSDTFTDDPIRPGTTTLKAVHFHELRRRIGALRAREGLPAVQWTDPTLVVAVTPVKRMHLMELQAALDMVYDAVGLARPSYTDAAVGEGATPIKAVHFMELRTAVAALE